MSTNFTPRLRPSLDYEYQSTEKSRKIRFSFRISVRIAAAESLDKRHQVFARIIYHTFQCVQTDIQITLAGEFFDWVPLSHITTVCHHRVPSAANLSRYPAGGEECDSLDANHGVLPITGVYQLHNLSWFTNRDKLLPTIWSTDAEFYHTL